MWSVDMSASQDMIEIFSDYICACLPHSFQGVAYEAADANASRESPGFLQKTTRHLPKLGVMRVMDRRWSTAYVSALLFSKFSQMYMVTSDGVVALAICFYRLLVLSTLVCSTYAIEKY